MSKSIDEALKLFQEISRDIKFSGLTRDNDLRLRKANRELMDSIRRVFCGAS